MRKELGDDVEGTLKYQLLVNRPPKEVVELGRKLGTLTPYCAENKLNCSVLLSYEIQADCNSGLADHNSTNMVADTDWRDLRSVE